MNVFRLWKIGIAGLLIASLLVPAAQPVRAASAAQDSTGGQLSGNFAGLNADQPPTVVSTVPGNGDIAQATTNIYITFSEIVAVQGEWFTITCESGPVTATAGAGPASVYMLNPTRTLGSSDYCTVTIHHTQVSDVDNVAPDQMAADYSWSFLTDIIDNGPFVVSTTPANNAVEVAANANLLITFDREVTLGTYSLVCGSTQIPSTASSTNKVDFIIDPTTSLPGGSECALTIPANQVTEFAYPNQKMATDLTLIFTVTYCGTTHTQISAIQQAGTASMLAGQDVTVEGIVTADFQTDSQLNGFFLQSLAGDVDGNPATSEGLFVATGTGVPVINVSVGDYVRFSARVAEITSASAGQMASMTGLNQVAPASLRICASGVELPAAQALDLPASTDANLYLEAFEGMRVQFTSPMVVVQSAYLGRFGQLSLGAYGRIYHPNNGTGAGDLRRLVVLDDASFTEYPFPLSNYSVNGAVRAGDAVGNLIGVLDQGRINDSTAQAAGLPDVYYRLQPTSAPQFTPSNERSAPPSVGGTIKVASFNLNDYFITIDDISHYGGSWPAGSGYGVGKTPRGADSVDEFNRQQAKLVKALAAMQADVYALSELEAWDGANAAAQLALALNTELAAPNRYAAVVDPFDPTPGARDMTQVALIYNTASLSLVGSSEGSANAVFDHAPLAQRFKFGNESFWVVANQFKTRGSCPVSGPDADQGNGQGCWQDTRNQQAAALADFVTAVLKPVDPDVLVVGDLNAYAAEQPIQTLLASGLTNQVEDNVPELQRYSISIDSMSGYIDHALSTASITRQLAGIEFWTINADEPFVIDYNTENKRFNGATSGSPDLYLSDPYASSDHDPLLIGLTLFANQAPQVSNPIADQQVVADAQFGFQIPANTFVDVNTGQLNGREDNLTFTATLSNGSPLPGWLSFNEVTGEFSGSPAFSDIGTIAVKVTATDTSGASVSDTFNLVVKGQLFLPAMLRLP